MTHDVLDCVKLLAKQISMSFRQCPNPFCEYFPDYFPGHSLSGNCPANFQVFLLNDVEWDMLDFCRFAPCP